MIRLRCWLRTPDGESTPVGEIRVADPDPRSGALKGAFRYEASYLAAAHAFALDPVHLPLAPSTFEAERPAAGIHGVFEDSLPDAWGRGLMIRRLDLPRKRQTPPHLLAALGGNGLGALAYGDAANPPPWPSANTDLAALVEAAEHYDQDPGALDDHQLALLFRAASSPGGARPKVLVTTEGSHWLAKLPSSRDEVDLVRVEAACLALARAAGLNVPDHRLEKLGRRPVLLIKRFDISPSGGRYHVASMQTLIGAEGYYQIGYADLADILRRLSTVPERDLPALYRQMVYNAFLGNTDDHLKNFAMLRDELGWRSTPAFDLVPDVPPRGEHVLHFGTAGHRPTPGSLVDLGKAFGLSIQRTAAIREEVARALADWRDVFAGCEVPEADRVRIGRDLDARWGRLTARG